MIKKIITLTLFWCSLNLFAKQTINYTKTSQKLLQNLIENKPFRAEVKTLAKGSLKDLILELNTDEKK